MAQLLQNDPGFEAFLNQQVGNGTTWGDYMSMPMPDAYALERQYRQQQAAQQAQKQAPVQQPVQDPWASVGGRNFDSATGTFRNTGHTIADLDRAIQAQQAVRQQQAQTPVVRQGGTGTVRNGRGAVRNGNGSGTKGGTGTTPPAQPTAPVYDSNWVNGSYGDIVALSKQLAEAERKQQPTEQKTSKPTIAPDGYMEGFDDISELPVGRSAQASKSSHNPVVGTAYDTNGDMLTMYKDGTVDRESVNPEDSEKEYPWEQGQPVRKTSPSVVRPDIGDIEVVDGGARSTGDKLEGLLRKYTDISKIPGLQGLAPYVQGMNFRDIDALMNLLPLGMFKNAGGFMKSSGPSNETLHEGFRKLNQVSQAKSNASMFPWTVPGRVGAPQTMQEVRQAASEQAFPWMRGLLK